MQIKAHKREKAIYVKEKKLYQFCFTKNFKN